MIKKKILSICVAAALVITTTLTTISAKNDDRVDVIGLFEINGATTKMQEESIDFKLTSTKATIKFTNPIAMSGFSFRWNGVDDSKKKLEKLNLKLTDKDNENNSLLVTFGRLSDDFTSVKINNQGKTYLTKGSTYKKNNEDISISFNENLNSFADDAGSYKVTVDTNLNGDIFEGFQKKGAILELVVEGAKGTTFSLKTINGQSFGNAYTTDNMEPIICIPNVEKSAEKGSVKVLQAATAYDVLKSESTLKLTVQDPDGDVVKDEKGTELKDVDGNKEYEVKFSKFGQYRILYVASDGENKTRNTGYQINVNDTGAPNIELEDEMESEIKVGETLEFPKLKITDNKDDKFTSWAYVKCPSGVVRHAKDKYKLDEEGVYKITFCAQDESGNIGYYEKEILAKGGK